MSVSATPPTSGGSGSIRLGRGSCGTNPTPHSATFWAPAKIKADGIYCLYFCLFCRPKRRQQPERYAKVFVENIYLLLKIEIFLYYF